MVSSLNSESAKKYTLSPVLIPIISKKCPFRGKYSNPSGRCSFIAIGLDSFASKVLPFNSLKGYPPYKKAGSKIGNFTKHSSIPICHNFTIGSILNDLISSYMICI